MTVSVGSENYQNSPCVGASKGRSHYPRQQLLPRKTCAVVILFIPNTRSYVSNLFVSHISHCPIKSSTIYVTGNIRKVYACKLILTVASIRWLQSTVASKGHTLFSLLFFTSDLAATFLRLSCDFLATFLQVATFLGLSCDLAATFLLLSYYFLATCYFLATQLRLSCYFLVTQLRLSCDLAATFLRLSCYFLATQLPLSCDLAATFFATQLLLSCNLAATFL